MPDRSVDVLGLQGGAVARRQAAGAGIAPYTIRSRVRSGRWQRLQRGVYASFSGEPTRETTLWAALLRAGPDAVLSHQTAAERHGLIDEPSSLIVITVPLSRTPTRAKIPGVVIHRSDAILRTRHPAMLPPCTRVEDTVLDLIQIAPTFDDAYAWICRAVGRGAPPPSGYARPWTLARRCAGAVSLRWRWVTPGMASCRCWSTATFTGWNARTGLPAARRQVRIRQRTGNKYLDNLYQEYGVCSELDGTAAHPADEQWRDKRRDNANAVQGIVTLRFGFADLGDRRCQTAADVAAVLRLRGWTGVAHPCSRPACALRDAVS